MKKIKVFLGGFTNYTNAQNLNCRDLAINLDKSQFKIYTVSLAGGKLSTIKNKADVKVFHCFRPLNISIYLGFLWGIWNCDVAYLPKGELWKFNRFLLRLFGKKSFSTIEGILDADNLKSTIEVLEEYDNVIASKAFVTRSYAITNFLGKYNKKHHNIDVEPSPLYLGCTTSDFTNNCIRSGLLQNVVYIGRLKSRKGIYDFLKIAAHFRDLKFYIFGDGEERISIEIQIKEKSLKNIKLMGIADHATLSKFLQKADLHILPSRSEGFPKVTLETAAAGVPSIVYNDYGADEWITHGVNGWVIKTLDDIISVVEELKNNPAKLKVISKEATKLAESFDWRIKVKDWENEIIKLYRE